MVSGQGWACQADGCSRQIPTTIIFCDKHWALLPVENRRQLWGSIRPGDKPNAACRRAEAQAIRVIREAERRKETERTVVTIPRKIRESLVRYECMVGDIDAILLQAQPSMIQKLPYIGPGVHGHMVEQGNVTYIPMIVAHTPGSGEVGRWLSSLAQERTWKIPCVISQRLRGMLTRRGWETIIEKVTSAHVPPGEPVILGDNVEVFVRWARSWPQGLQI